MYTYQSSSNSFSSSHQHFIPIPEDVPIIEETIKIEDDQIPVLTKKRLAQHYKPISHNVTTRYRREVKPNPKYQQTYHIQQIQQSSSSH